MSRKRKQRSLLPEQYQLPATLFMAVVFVVVLYFQFGKKKTAVAAAPVVAGQPAVAGAPALALPPDAGLAMVTQLNEAMLQLKKAAAAPAPTQAIAPLAGNPFFPAAFELQRIDSEEGESAAAGNAAMQAPEEPEPEPVSELVVEETPLPVLTGVLVQGAHKVAILDGDYVHVGERKGDFTVADIQERRVLLKNEDGPHWVDVVRPLNRGKAAPATSVMVKSLAPEKEEQGQ